MEAATATAAVDKISYRDLYARWEKGNWSALDLDFSQDKHDWNEVFTDHERAAALWNYSLFFHGEDSVADNLSPYIDAAPREEQKYFLTTQQVDEARHAVFFARFMREVVGRGEDSVASSLAATKPELTWGFRKTFEHLDKIADDLRKDRSRPMFAKAIAMYHIVVEATLAVPGQHFIEEYVTERGILPGFAEGMRNVSKDEQRHIGFGVKCLYDLQQEDPECRHAVAELLREVMPYSVGVFVPPGGDETYVTTFGKSIEDVYEDGMISLETKLKTAGMPLEDLPGVPIRTDISPRQRAEEALKLVRANIIGNKAGPPSREREVVQIMFDNIRYGLDTRYAPNNGGKSVVQWDFTDFEPWHVVIDNGNTRAEHGRVESPDITIRCAYEDWVDVTAGWADPTQLMLKGKLRPSGKLTNLWRARKLFPG